MTTEEEKKSERKSMCVSTKSRDLVDNCPGRRKKFQHTPTRTGVEKDKKEKKKKVNNKKKVTKKQGQEWCGVVKRERM